MAASHSKHRATSIKRNDDIFVETNGSGSGSLGTAQTWWPAATVGCSVINTLKYCGDYYNSSILTKR